jgi:hypothetical protein
LTAAQLVVVGICVFSIVLSMWLIADGADWDNTRNDPIRNWLDRRAGR